MIRMDLVRRVLGALGIAVLALVWLPVTANGQETSQVFVVHGIPGQPVDVYVNGERTLSNFAPKEIAGPLDLPAGDYDLALTAPGESIDNAILEVTDVAVPGGQNLSVAAHLSADGEPTITPFVNDTSALAAGQARLTVRHTAAAPAVDVRANGSPVFTDLTNPNEATADVAAGTASADVVLAGTDTVVLGPADVDLAEGTATIIYAIGSAEDQTLDIVAQVLEDLAGAPEGVPAGSGGLVVDGTSAVPFAIGMGVLGVLLLIGGAAYARRRGAHD